MRLSAIALVSLLLTACGSPSAKPSDDETGTSSTETTTTSDTGGFTGIPFEDFGSPSNCDPWQQDCPMGEKCVPYASAGGKWDANKCVPVLGDGAAGEPCSSDGPVVATDDCDETGVCWNVMEVDGKAVGTCQPFCLGTPDNPSCTEGWFCRLYADGTLTICELPCNPLGSDCGAGLGCYWVSTEFLCVPTTQGIPVGEPCGYVDDCAAGLGCVAADRLPSCEGSACCTSFCDLELGDGPCDALVPGTSCVAFFEIGEAPVGQGNIGMCMVP